MNNYSITRSNWNILARLIRNGNIKQHFKFGDHFNGREQIRFLEIL